MKPDAIQRGLIGEVFVRLERSGLKIAACKMMRLSEALIRDHYSHHTDKPFFDDLAKFMRSSPVIVAVAEGPQAVETVRIIAGTSHTQVGTIRGDFTNSMQVNLIHTSDSVANAEKEISRFFNETEIFEYDMLSWKNIYSEEDLKKQ